MGEMGSVGIGDGVSVTGIKVAVGTGVDGKAIVGRMVSVCAGVPADAQAVNTPARNKISSAFFMSFPFIY